MDIATNGGGSEIANNEPGCRAADRDSIAPLIELCKAGRLFDVQAWIVANKPVNVPAHTGKGRRHITPLQIATEKGFHSLIEVLLKAGAIQEPIGWGSPMDQALRMHRLDLIELLVAHGFDSKTIRMDQVFNTWKPEIIEFFILNGGDLRKDQPFAKAFCNRIRMALKYYKQYRETIPELQEQANIALRHHCKEGNLKWISLMLWAGADLWESGPETPAEPAEEQFGIPALGWAALYKRYEVFDLKPIRSQLSNPRATAILRYLTQEGGIAILQTILELGVSPNDKDGGCGALDSCFSQMTWIYGAHNHSWLNTSGKIDTDRSREAMKAINLLAKHGARWVPADQRRINDVRRSFLKLIPDYTLEFVWVMAKYRACQKNAILQLLSTPTIKRHLGDRQSRATQLLESWID